MKIHPYEHFHESLEPLLTSKAEELKLFGYGKVTNDQLWEFLQLKVWKKPVDEPRLSQLVNDVLGIKAGDFMNFKTVESFRSPNWFEDIDQNELEVLLYGVKNEDSDG